MTLEERISEDIKTSMLNRDTDRLAALRAVKAAILLEKTAGKAHELTDGDVVRLMQKLVKQRRESAQIYGAAGRPELADKETAEADYIEEYLPKKLNEEEIEELLREIISSVGASGPSDMGKVMGVATKRLAGAADGKVISEIVKRLLGS